MTQKDKKTKDERFATIMFIVGLMGIIILLAVVGLFHHLKDFMP